METQVLKGFGTEGTIGPLSPAMMLHDEPQLPQRWRKRLKAAAGRQIRGLVFASHEMVGYRHGRPVFRQISQQPLGQISWKSAGTPWPKRTSTLGFRHI